ncbi:MAG TPA: twin-arginine translocation signal domain-containing protein [Terracidiphilus sp.]|nr:twin-arginine translocation signal domain-containing protein [Terracidiphilus sp.]
MSVPIVPQLSSVPGTGSRRDFLKGIGAAGAGMLGRSAWSGSIPHAARGSAERAGKSITLLNDGGFRGSAWGWQLTTGARIVAPSRRRGNRAIEVETSSGDYARFLVLGPEVGRKYTLSGWVRTQDLREGEEQAGAYFTASQFEFQGRPTEFTIDGKQPPEKRFGNFTGSMDWKRFSQTFTCLPTTTWFEIVVGIYRAAGTAWFTELTFVAGEQPADLDDTVDVWQALEWAHQDSMRDAAELRKRNGVDAAIFRDRIPVRGTASTPEQLARILSERYATTFVTADEMADAARFNSKQFDLLVLPYGESFPLAARGAVQKFLSEGGDLLTTGGYAFQSPLVRENGVWLFYDGLIEKQNSPNLLSNLVPDHPGWKANEEKYASVEGVDLPSFDRQPAAKIEIPNGLWGQNAFWSFELAAKGAGNQFQFEAWLRASDVRPAPEGSAYISIDQLDEKGEAIWGPCLVLEDLRGSHDWHRVERLIYLAPGCVKLRIGVGLRNATGTLWASRLSLEARSPAVRMNTSRGFPQDELQIDPGQIGMFDADSHLTRVSSLRAASGHFIVPEIGELKGRFSGFAATCVLGLNQARRIPLLDAHDAFGRRRGAAGALVHNMRGNYARGSWAFFGVDNQDIFAPGLSFGESTLRAAGRALTRKCFLHGCEADFACYRNGETVRLRVLITNFGRAPAALELRWSVGSLDSDQVEFRESTGVNLSAGQTLAIETEWRTAQFVHEQYCVRASVFEQDATAAIDALETGFIVWRPESLAKGIQFTFEDNYFQVNGRSLFLQGTDDYAHAFVDQDENQLTWRDDAQGCADSCLNVYENLMGLRGPQERPTETWWRWIDAMMLGVQRTGGIFFPGMLVFANTAVADIDLADQRAFVRAFAERYRDVNGIMYYLNGDLELHDPNLPDLQALYNRTLLEKYGSDEALRKAWSITPPEAPIGKLKIRPGADNWHDVRTLDEYQFRTQVVRRWLNALHDSIREVDTKHPVTAEFYQVPVSGIDLLDGIGKLELANFGYFNPPGDDFFHFPQTCKFLDQSLRGKGINVGEFGVKTHPAWKDASDYIAARSEAYEHAYFLSITHYAFALGVSKIQNWSWKYPSDLPFEWGINYSNDLVPRDVLAYYRNAGLMFRHLRPKYESSDVVYLLAGDNRKGGLGSSVVEGQMNGIRLLIDQRLRFGTLADDFIDAMPRNVKTIFYPLSYCPSDAIVGWLTEYVEQGGQLYLSGDISYDPLRQRTRTERLKDLCGLEFVAQRYTGIDYKNAALQTLPRDSKWPTYAAAPGIVTRPAGATVLMAAEDGTPIVTVFNKGTGRVIFNVDPVELHASSRYHAYGHDVYRAVLDEFQLSGIALEPNRANVHAFCVPSQDDRDIRVLVNYNESGENQAITVPTGAGEVKLSVKSLFPAIVVSAPGKGVQAIESSGDVFVEGQMLIGADLHFMAVSFDRQSLLASTRLLLLPMGEGTMRIENAKRWRKPIVLTGEMKESRWKQYASARQDNVDGRLTVNIDSARSLSMMILCEIDEQDEAIRKIEKWVSSPWALAD